MFSKRINPGSNHTSINAFMFLNISSTLEIYETKLQCQRLCFVSLFVVVANVAGFEGFFVY